MTRDLCQHGAAYPTCQGAPDRGIAPCPPGDYHYCPHGVDTQLTTADHQPRCPTCRGVTRHHRNPQTWTPRRQPATQPALTWTDDR